MLALSIKNLEKVYKNNVVALTGINFNVTVGDFFALLGPNGAGKSTTIGIISSLIKKTSGQITIFDYDLDQQPELAKACIGVVPQEFNSGLFEKVIDVVINQAGFYGVSYRLAKQRAEFYLKKLYLWEQRKKPVMALSGGMKRRLMIARALMHEPNLLILDEPTAGVDIEIRRSMWEFLRELNEEGTTIILTTHYLEEAENLCKNIAIMDQGKIIENTSTKNLLGKLNSEIFVFYLQHDLHTLPIIKDFPAHLIDENTIEVEVKNNQSLNDLFSQFSQHNIQISSMRNKANRLEELFLRLIKNHE